ncbi:hypothetical protein LCGC14_1368420 [marine sediment metagenome]|uniref:NTP pyrophosphohydrolase MazG putative catalytic core domain-containing protein n=1 Tax=marine sediment metagenome TaxID=412755 RepID=A0A0F9N830_9ZZZZ
MTKVRARKSLAQFTRYMEVRLRENDYKKGWRDMSREELLTRLLEEIIELATARTDEDRTKECCDVANFAMMIFDNIINDW